MIAVIAAVGIVVIAAGYLLQYGGYFSLNTDQAAIESNTVRLNEIVAQNLSSLVTESGDVPDWVEITNTGSESVNLAHYSLVLESNINNMFVFPEHTLGSGEHLLVYCRGAERVQDGYKFNAPFKLEASGGDKLILLNANGKAVDAVALPELSGGEAYMRTGAEGWAVGVPTPGADNSAMQDAPHKGITVVADAMEISEVSGANTLYFADERGEHHDYVEIHNSGDTDVNLRGWYLSDSSEKLKRWAFPEVVVPAGGYLAVHCSGYNRIENPAHLHTDFKLNGDGETVYLSRPDGHTVSKVEVPALQTDQVYSCTDGEWGTQIAATPGAANTVEAAIQVNTNTFGDKNASLRINEIMASATVQAHDWVEIYNGTGSAMDIGGYGLSDDPGKPRKWQFPEGTVIQPGEYMGVYMSGMQESEIDGFLNADFSISSGGGSTVSLSDPTGKVLDAAYLSKQYGGISYGRLQGMQGHYLLETATPGADNAGNAYYSRAAEAKVSIPGGMFASGDSFAVELSAPAGSSIYYTLDCTDPTQASTLYTGPIPVSGNTVIRSRVYRDGYMPSLTDTQSYLFDVYNEGRAFVVSVVSDPVNLYGASGIISNYKEEWAREGHIEIFKPDGENIISQGCELSLHGMDSRKLPVKSFNVIARSEYGENRLNYPIFSERDYESYHSILLRPSGEDYNMSFMRDTLLTSLMKDTSVLYQKYEIAVCYLNGEYYTLYYIRERMNKYSICQFEGWEGMEDQIDIVKANTMVTQGSNDDFEALLQWIKSNDTTTDAAYEYIGSQIDIQNFIEYMSLQIFVGNTDTLNVRRYRNVYDDAKWRWILYDLDWAFFNDTDSIKKWLTPGGTGVGRRTDNTLFIGCMKNPTFREQFLTYFGEQMATNFTSENIVAKMDERLALLGDMLQQYLDKYEMRMDVGLKKFRRYAEERPNKLLNTYFKECFNFSDAQMEKYFGDALDKIQEYAEGKAGE